jgi:glycerophosphoryl diester phosphodiesterase
MIKFYWRETDLDLALAFAKFIQAKSIHPHFHLLTKKTPQIQEKDCRFSPGPSMS